MAIRFTEDPHGWLHSARLDRAAPWATRGADPLVSHAPEDLGGDYDTETESTSDQTLASEVVLLQIRAAKELVEVLPKSPDTVRILLPLLKDSTKISAEELGCRVWSQKTQNFAAGKWWSKG